MREIAAEFETWTRLGDTPSWSPEMCRSPPPPKPLVSRSRDEVSHGRKLYFLYARDVAAYRSAAARNQPVDQGFVKKSFEPLKVDANDLQFKTDAYRGRAVSRAGQRWRIGSPQDLFVMYKLDPSTPNTDNGWVYGTITRSGEVTSAGRVASCMECHLEAKNDRMFGANAEDFVAEDGYEAWELNQQEE